MLSPPAQSSTSGRNRRGGRSRRGKGAPLRIMASPPPQSDFQPRSYNPGHATSSSQPMIPSSSANRRPDATYYNPSRTRNYVLERSPVVSESGRSVAPSPRVVYPKLEPETSPTPVWATSPEPRFARHATQPPDVCSPIHSSRSCPRSSLNVMFKVQGEAYVRPLLGAWVVVVFSLFLSLVLV